MELIQKIVHKVIILPLLQSVLRHLMLYHSLEKAYVFSYWSIDEYVWYKMKFIVLYQLRCKVLKRLQNFGGQKNTNDCQAIYMHCVAVKTRFILRTFSSLARNINNDPVLKL